MKKLYFILILLFLAILNSFAQTGTIKVVKPINDSLGIIGNWTIYKERVVFKAKNYDKTHKINGKLKINSDGTFFKKKNNEISDGLWEIGNGKLVFHYKKGGKTTFTIIDKNGNKLKLFLSKEDNITDAEVYSYLKKED